MREVHTNRERVSQRVLILLYRTSHTRKHTHTHTTHTHTHTLTKRKLFSSFSALPAMSLPPSLLITYFAVEMICSLLDCVYVSHSLSLSLSESHTHTLSLSLCLTHILTHAHTHTHTHTRTHTHTHTHHSLPPQQELHDAVLL